jgi:glycogen synthase kinase 3 beta
MTHRPKGSRAALARSPTKEARLSGPVLTLQPHERFRSKSTIGVGTFGAVFLAIDRETGREVAIKKVCLDPHFKNRELAIVEMLHHPNCLRLVTSYTTTEGKFIFLHLVTDYLPQSLANFGARLHGMFLPYLQIFGYQVFAGLCYLHAHGVCHRDIKPSNVLIDDQNGRLQLCDFGSAKFLQPNEVSVSYIATRSYRAPELLLDCPSYTTAVDVWAAGCVLTEIVTAGRPLFQGSNNDELLGAIVRTIGMPRTGDFDGFPHKKRFQVPPGKIGSLEEAMPKGVGPEFLDLLSAIFVYAPSRRATAAQCMKHPFFADCVTGEVQIPSHAPLPEYFTLIRSPEEMLANFPDGP